jgi:hypothetical protein
MNYDFSKWHPMCVNKGLVLGSDGLSVYCLDCSIVANLEAISGKISPESACVVGKDVARPTQGDQSPNVNKGEVKKA